ncbi:lipid-A-disaccharide synthase [Rivularia sp. UHCC 0363]|uniref:lipid-A-disaccharide synthase n=1 Tax=Rivularia sp. UHCC 0363 TaxID=3110244 RepID=UPI002B1ECDAC|nr:lipid-A-disaccharide synthase [Rivularia sp. UHCC 0363]MEA5597798.1 lipid-A-disaccharide synthase [Rivularia sp. UHCC 0363]
MFDILILSNGPGEITTWVRPVVKSLREKLGNDRHQVRISIVLSPCANASGKEADIALSYPEVDRVQPSSDFFPFLLTGKTADNWDWREKGVVVFLGGDQFFPVVIGKRLGYRTVVYAEWEARWHSLINRFGVMKPQVMAKVSPKYIDKFTVVGDLMAEVGVEGIRGQGEDLTSESKIHSRSVSEGHNLKSKIELVGILPGSKAAKLAQGVPLSLAIAQHIHDKLPETKFFIPVAPTLNLATLASFADAQKNPMSQYFGGVSAKLIDAEQPYLQTSTGLQVELFLEHPAYEMLSKCSICLTTVGANTAELGSLAIPMIVLLPTQQLDAMRSWDGIPGIFANLPLVGSSFAKLINWYFLRRKGLLAWPNIWAQQEIVPELVGKLQPQEVGDIVVDYLQNPEKLADMSAKLRRVRGDTGAAAKLTQLVFEELQKQV